ncbi:MAG: DoxX family protein [Ktedonobacteraceae bacterium]|jgi:putative oxidoreductase
MSLVRSLGHVFLSGVFISGGADAFLQPGGRVDKVADAGIPEAKQAVVLNGAAMVVAGTALALDIAPKVAATVLLGTMVPTTFVGHPFWKEKEAASYKNQRIQFFKNLGLIGGLLLVLAEKKK